MKAYYLQVKQAINIIVIGTLAIYGIGLFCQSKATLDEIVKLVQVSYPVLIITLLYLYFENYGWHHKFWDMVLVNKLLKFPPDLRGRWEGTIHREQDDSDHTLILEIQQSLSNILITTYSRTGNISASIIEEFTTDTKHENNFCICFLWDGTGSKLPSEPAKNGRFYGYTMLRIIIDANEKKLTGHYFTDRVTKGSAKLTWVGSKLKYSF